MPKWEICIDDCPKCGYELAQIAFEQSLVPGDDITCPECKLELTVGLYDEGWERYYTFYV